MAQQCVIAQIIERVASVVVIHNEQSGASFPIKGVTEQL
ncbi:hypothetical protein CEV34_4374 [Brucella pseudogrignonensis]|uniref:Uncharacterized protein n=1 Tax=Brucella pseudogrignonensis TaxID=419475 RepID=A0A256G603_9HYPH|nr:hypothetical protein CEV34_4374 [Brucella pseudogrignonensis]